MEQLYVLQLEDGKYYVGKTKDIRRRVGEHASGSGSSWTTTHKPIKVMEVRPLTGAHDENNTTKDLMKKHGVDNVRGGSYTAVNLPEAVKSVLQSEIRAGSDACFKCGREGHFANKCTEICAPDEELEWECYHCPQTFATESACNSHERTCRAKQEEEEWGCEYCDRTFTTKFGCSVHERSCRPPSPPTKKSGSCYRCGRTGHWSPECYAKTDTDGNDLDDVDESVGKSYRRGGYRRRNY